MTGWRLGAAVGPKDLITHINKLNTNSEACTTHFVQYAGIAALTNPEGAEFTKHLVATLRERRDLIVQLANKVQGFKAYSPEATFYLFVNVTEAMRMKNISSLEEFRKTCLRETGVSFCTREHFGAPLSFETQKYIRFAFSSSTTSDIEQAFGILSKWMADPKTSS